jgi:hypothetical protein
MLILEAISSKESKIGRTVAQNDRYVECEKRICTLMGFSMLDGDDYDG